MNAFRALALSCMLVALFALILCAQQVDGEEDNFEYATPSSWLPIPASKITSEESDALKKVLPRVTFDCKGKTGYFPDAKFNCEVFHYCKPDGARNTFLCPKNSLFNQLSMVCEEKTTTNAKLCREGSIVTKASDQETSKKSLGEKYQPKMQLEGLLKPTEILSNFTGKDTNSKSTLKKGLDTVITLEELLSYMNSGGNANNNEPTFISTFQNPGGELSSKTLVNASKVLTSTTNTETTVTIGISPVIEKQTTIASEIFTRKFTTAKPFVQPQKNVSELNEDLSIEHAAVAGPKHRKHKRIGRVIGVSVQKSETNQKQHPAPHSHVSARSPTEKPPVFDDLSAQSSEQVLENRNASRSLFTTDRQRVKDFRKRRRFNNRRRKMQRTTETTTDLPITTSNSDFEFPRQDNKENARPTEPRRKKLHRPRSEHIGRENDWKGITKLDKVEPYTLPALPMPEDIRTATSGHPVLHETKKNQAEHGGTTRNTKAKAETNESNNIKFGKKITDDNYYQYHDEGESRKGLSELVESLRGKHAPESSDELLTEEHQEHRTFEHSKHSTGAMEKKNRKSKFRQHLSEESGDSYFSHPSEDKNKKMISDDVFFPPRADKTESKHQSRDENVYETSKEDYGSTTENPYRVTRPYLDKYQSNIKELAEYEEQRWKISDDKTKKVTVGSTFSTQTVTPETERFQVPPTTEAPTTNKVHVNSRKELPKHTVAQQHLSKIMNDFFAMSSSNIPGRNQMFSIKNQDEMYVPDYRIPSEDLYEDSESAAEEMDDLPPELLEVVDLLAGHSAENKKDTKPFASHEIIKINGPITESHIEKIFADDKSSNEQTDSLTRKGSFQKMIVVPPEEKEDMREIAEVAKFASLRLEPLLKQIMSEENKLHNIASVKKGTIRSSSPTVLTAKKVPVRFIYRNQFSESKPSKIMAPKPNLKILQSHLPSSNIQVIQKGRMRPHRNHVNQMYATQQSPMVLHPPSVFPPHPPPLPRRPLLSRPRYPFPSRIRPFMNNIRYPPRRRKRSIMSRPRRQLRPNQRFNPFANPLFPKFNTKFVPTFTPFKSIFNSNLMSTAGSSLSSLPFPAYAIQKPPLSRPQFFQPFQRPLPVKHVTQNGQQAVIVEEIPIPIPIDVAASNILRPPHSSAKPTKIIPQFPINNAFRSSSTPVLQRPPLLQGLPLQYRPINLPANNKPPSMNYRPLPVPFPSPLPSSITSQGQIYALGVTDKPFIQAKPLPPRPNQVVSNGIKKPPNRIPQPFGHIEVHPKAYPNFPYFHAPLTTPLTSEPIVGRLMYSGYKPPKTTIGTKRPRSHNQPTKELSSSHMKPRPVQKFFEGPSIPPPSVTRFTETGNIRSRTPIKPNLEDASKEFKFKPPRQNLASSSSTEDTVPRRRRPGRRRRPRPRNQAISTAPTMISSFDMSPTPPPPEQIPPPPADFTTNPLIQEVPSAMKQNSMFETTSNYPPAGYYGRDQLVQFFDSSSKSYKKTSTPKPYQQRDLGEGSSSTESDESFSSFSTEDGEPAFGTRLRSKSRGQARNASQKKKLQASSQTQNTEVRAKPNPRPHVPKPPSPAVNEAEIRPEVRNRNKNNGGPPRRRKPPQPRPRARPVPIPATQSQMRYFNPTESASGFYSVPRGLQGLVAPSEMPPHAYRGSTDMFGIPHPIIDKSVYSLRPQGAPVDFNSNFFSVPPHVAKQHQSPLHQMNVKSVPESERDFFTAPDVGSSNNRDNASQKNKDQDDKSVSTETTNEQREPTAIKQRKPKRKNRYNPRGGQQTRPNLKSVNLGTERTRQKDNYDVKSSTTTLPTTAQSAPNSNSPNDIQEPHIVFKPRPHQLPKTLPELSKSILNGKLDINKLNATISTSVSVSGGSQPNNDTNSSENTHKRVFSSKNGGLSVVRKGPKRKRTRQRITTTTNDPFVNDNESSTDAKYEIAASVLDIIKATTDSERQASGFYSNTYPQIEQNPSSKAWVLKTPNEQGKRDIR